MAFIESNDSAQGSAIHLVPAVTETCEALSVTGSQYQRTYSRITPTASGLVLLGVVVKHVGTGNVGTIQVSPSTDETDILASGTFNDAAAGFGADNLLDVPVPLVMGTKYYVQIDRLTSPDQRVYWTATSPVVTTPDGLLTVDLAIYNGSSYPETLAMKFLIQP